MRPRRILLLLVATASISAGILTTSGPAVASGTCAANFSNGNATPNYSGTTWTMPQVHVFGCTTSSTLDSIYVALQYSGNGTTWNGPYASLSTTVHTKGDEYFTVTFGPGAPCNPNYYFRARELNNDTGNSDYSASIRYLAGC